MSRRRSRLLSRPFAIAASEIASITPVAEMALQAARPHQIRQPRVRHHAPVLLGPRPGPSPPDAPARRGVPEPASGGRHGGAGADRQAQAVHGHCICQGRQFQVGLQAPVEVSGRVTIDQPACGIV